MLMAGFALLIASGDFLVKAGVSLAKSFNVSTLVIGVTVVSMGTSLPELFVSAEAAINGDPEIAMGNVIGSNIANIALVLAITAMIFPMAVKKISVFFDTPFMIAASILLYLFLLDNQLSLYEGLIFVVLLGLFVFWAFRRAKHGMPLKTVSDDKPQYSKLMAFVVIVISSVGLKYGAKWLVDGARFVAEQFHISKTIIAITLVAFGTSVPELATSVIAAIKKQPDISVGNIVGSNIFNILGVLGATSIIKPIEITDPSIRGFHLYWMLAIALLLFILVLPLFKLKVHRIKGFLFFMVYILYIFSMIRQGL